MAMTKAEQLEHLQELVTVAKDSELGYQTAAEHVDNPHLANVFSEYARQRAGFVEELTLEAARISGDVPAGNGTVKGAVFRGWVNLKSALTGGSGGSLRDGRRLCPKRLRTRATSSRRSGRRSRRPTSGMCHLKAQHLV